MNQTSIPQAKSSKSKKGDERVDWFDLFAELDPLANPDAIGRRRNEDQDRNC